MVSKDTVSMILLAKVESQLKVTILCAACRRKATVYLSMTDRWIELHQRKYLAHMAYTVNIRV